MSVLALAVGLVGSALLLVAALGLFRLPDALARQHAATKGGTLALWLILFGVSLEAGDAAWWWRGLIIVVLLLLTLPLSSHMLARAAVHERYSEQEVREARCARRDIANERDGER